VLFLLVTASPARAVLDVEDRGPMLDAGRFRMRVTNIGVLGNAFYNSSRSSDPSFEYPAYSGNELLNHAELWVGALDESGTPRVSGGPFLEWRPTLDPADRVYLKRRSDLGTRRGYDDDGDGKVDEELLNGKDDDGDGEIDEDLGLFADQEAGSDYADDRPEAVNYGYPTGEAHVPLGLDVHEEVSTWGVPEWNGIAAIHFHVKNHGTQTLRNVRLGLLADFDSRKREDHAGHRNDVVVARKYSATRFDGQSKITLNGVINCGAKPPCPPYLCFTKFSGGLPILIDGVEGSGLPAITLMPLDHTVDPLTRISPEIGRAPISVAFRTSIFSGEGIAGQGGVPLLDADRYAAMAGTLPEASPDRRDDFVELVTCGPFRVLAPGQSLDFTVAIVAGANADSVASVFGRLVLLHAGAEVDLLPNAVEHPDSADFAVGETGVSGHEVCLEPPPGVTFAIDPHCIAKIPTGDGTIREEPPVTYFPGTCIWTDLDCDPCTGNWGKESIVHWLDPGSVPPSPATRVTAEDHRVTIEWDNQPEVLIRGGHVGGPGSQFAGYRLFKLARWKDREGLLPPAANWQLLKTFSSETANSEVALAAITDTTVVDDRSLYEQKHYPIGRYRYVDRDVLNGFDYVYVVTSYYKDAIPMNGDATLGYNLVSIEGPIVATFDDRVTPRAEAVAAGKAVTVVPNPYRGSAAWDRSPVFGDALPHHVDFMHLPKAIATIKIFTLAGDFVAQIVHDGTQGNGESSWDLISRNGQEVESGVYLFSIESALGHQVGKFVIVR
jgi:hypothetical protein